MALIACNTCSAQIAAEAKSCPQCGAANAAAYKTIRYAGLVYLALLAALFYWIWGLMTP